MVDPISDPVRERLDALAAAAAGDDQDGAGLERVVRLAVSLIKPCRSAGITVTTGSEVRTAATSDGVASRGDQLQSELEQGPCVDAAERGEVVHVTDLQAEERWTRWSPRVVAELGVRSMLCLPLFSDHGRSGALNLYALRPDAFGPEDQAVAEALASNSALAAATAAKISQLETALDTRTTIGQATGLVMAEYHLDEHAAFALLTRLSQDSNEKINRIAARLVQQHNAGTTP